MADYLDAQQMIPYAIELRDTVDAARYRLQQLVQLAAEWVENGRRWQEGTVDDVSDLARLGPIQSRVFDEIEGLLGALARVSYLVFPVRETGFAKRRAESIRDGTGLTSGSVINSRELRDSWVHHDERLDAAVQAGNGAAGQRFALSSEVTADMKRTFLRIVEMDTLVIHYRARDGGQLSTSLREIGTALADLDETRKALFRYRLDPA